MSKLAKQLRITNEQMLVLALIGFGVLLRLLPLVLTGHLGNNFAPITAIALLGSVYLSKRYAVWLPLAVMAVTDVFLGFHSLIVFTWGTYAVVGLLGLWLRNNKTVLNTLVAALTGSLLFFFVTNLAVWAFTPMYAHNFAGLTQCFVMALPFFRNTLASDLFYVATLFGVMEAANYFSKRAISQRSSN